MYANDGDPYVYTIADISALQVQPEPLTRPEVAGKMKSRISGDATLAVHDLVDPTRRRADRGGDAMLGHTVVHGSRCAIGR